IEEWAERLDAYGLDTEELERRAPHRVHARRAIEEPVRERRRIHRRDQMRRPPAEQSFVAARVVGVTKREARHEHAIEEALHERRHRAPPRRKDEDDVARPGDELAV